MTRVAVISGGVGAARFLRGLLEVVDPGAVTAIVNVGDDAGKGYALYRAVAGHNGISR